MFSESFLKRIKGSKYQGWAEGLTEETLFHMFHAIGEYAIRSHLLLPLLEDPVANEHRDMGAYARALTGLKVLNDIAKTGTMSQERYGEIFGQEHYKRSVASRNKI